MARPYIMVAPNGARLGKADHPALPITLDDIAQTAKACHTAGADALHLHVRDADGAHSLDAGRYREALAHLAQDVPDMAVQITTEAVGRFRVDEQLACLRALKPAWASVAIRETARDAVLARRLYAQARDAGTRIQHILYDTADAALLAQWQADGIIQPDQTEVILVLGRYADGLPSDPDAVRAFHAALAPDTPWMICAFGASEHACLREAARLGGDLRVGFENSRTASDGTDWADNAASVAALVTALAQDDTAA